MKNLNCITLEELDRVVKNTTEISVFITGVIYEAGLLRRPANLLFSWIFVDNKCVLHVSYQDKEPTALLHKPISAVEAAYLEGFIMNQFSNSQYLTVKFHNPFLGGTDETLEEDKMG